MINQPIINIAEIFARKNVTDIVISPGSRSAPLTISFARHPNINTKIVPDERSAAFIGLGMAITKKQVVGLICTSGSAGLNYYPAIAEAYFQNVPLIILTADRPKEWIGQQDGQTIFQTEMYANHIKRSYDLPSDFTHKDAVWYTERVVSEAINVAMEEPRGPVHINIPLREPLYPSNNQEIIFSEQVKIVDSISSEKRLAGEEINLFIDKLLKVENKLIIVGQGHWDVQTMDHISSFSETFKIPVIGDVLSNFHSFKNVINTVDIFLNGPDDELIEYQPELLITFGASVISKNLKLFLRKFKAREHWHIQEAGNYPDTFQSVTKILRTTPSYFFNALKDKGISEQGKYKDTFYNKWLSKNKSTGLGIRSFFTKQPFSEFEAIKEAIDHLPPHSLLHLSNSMPVRYVNFLGLAGKDTASVYVNRGTSGIDGCNSTAVGAALSTPDLVTLITGDMAFFYDRNAFWHNYNLPNLRVIILNNHCGGIFGLIDGPANLPEREEYFETTQKLTAKNTATDFNMDYYFCRERKDLVEHLKDFFKPSTHAKILEVETDKEVNRQVYNDFKAFFKDRN